MELELTTNEYFGSVRHQIYDQVHNCNKGCTRRAANPQFLPIFRIRQITTAEAL